MAALRHLLDQIAPLLKQSYGAPEGIQILTDGLGAIKALVSPDCWSSILIPAARRHEVSGLIHQCPLTNHARLRPRGYPGDAGLLDLIYRHRTKNRQVRGATRLGKAIFDVTAAVPACEAVRNRRKLVAGKIDEVVAARPDADILAVACGNLREVELSAAFKTGFAGSFFAADQDPISLSAVQSYAAKSGGRIRPLRLTVRDLIAARHDLPQFDFIYSTGLYDYLQSPVAARLTRRLFGNLKSGGKLLLANFLPDIWEAPYMEAYMDWHLIYRDEREICGFLREIDPAEIESRRYWTDAEKCIGYIEVVRR